MRFSSFNLSFFWHEPSSVGTVCRGAEIHRHWNKISLVGNYFIDNYLLPYYTLPCCEVTVHSGLTRHDSDERKLTVKTHIPSFQRPSGRILKPEGNVDELLEATLAQSLWVQNEDLQPKLRKYNVIPGLWIGME